MESKFNLIYGNGILSYLSFQSLKNLELLEDSSPIFSFKSCVEIFL